MNIRFKWFYLFQVQTDHQQYSSLTFLFFTYLLSYHFYLTISYFFFIISFEKWHNLVGLQRKTANNVI